jgi:hypothetical protein
VATTNLRLRLRRVNIDNAVLVEKGGPVYAATERAAEAAVKLAKQEAPKRSGELADSLEYRLVQTPTRVVADIGAGPGIGQNGASFVDVLRWVTFGTTGPIVSTTLGKSMVLRNTLGSPLYRASVEGQEPNPFILRAVRRIRKSDFEP